MRALYINRFRSSKRLYKHVYHWFHSTNIDRGSNRRLLTLINLHCIVAVGSPHASVIPINQSGSEIWSEKTIVFYFYHCEACIVLNGVFDIVWLIDWLIGWQSFEMPSLPSFQSVWILWMRMKKKRLRSSDDDENESGKHQIYRCSGSQLFRSSIHPHVAMLLTLYGIWKRVKSDPPDRPAINKRPVWTMWCWPNHPVHHGDNLWTLHCL